MPIAGDPTSVLSHGLIVTSGGLVDAVSVLSQGLLVDGSSTPSMSISPTTFVESSTGNVVSVTGVNTTWSGGTIFAVTSGIITSQTFISPTSFSLTYTAPGSVQSVTFSNSDDAATAGASITGSSCDYPTVNHVVFGVVYANGTMTGTFVCPSPPVPPPPVPVVPTANGAYPFARINQEIVARVASALGTTTDFVRPVANDAYVVTETENLFAYIRAYGPSPIDPLTGAPYPNIGAGRYQRIVGRRVRIYIYTRSGVDVYGGDEIALGGNDVDQLVTTPPTMPGQFVAEELILNALDDWSVIVPAVPTGFVGLTLGPLHFVDSGDGPPVRKPEDEEGLIRSHLDFQVCYVSAISPVEPAPDTLPVPDLN